MSDQGLEYFEHEESFIFHLLSEERRLELKEYLSPEIENRLIYDFKEEFKNWGTRRYKEHISAGSKIGFRIFSDLRNFRSVCIVDVGNVGGKSKDSEYVKKKLQTMLLKQRLHNDTLFIFVSSMEYTEGWLEKKFCSNDTFLIEELVELLQSLNIQNIQKPLICSVIIPPQKSYNVIKKNKAYTGRNQESFCRFENDNKYLHATCGLDDLVMNALRHYFMYYLHFHVYIITDDTKLESPLSQNDISIFLDTPFENIEVFDLHVFKSYYQFYKIYKMAQGPYDKVLDDLDFAESFNNQMRTHNDTEIKVVMPSNLPFNFISLNDFVFHYSNISFKNTFQEKKAALDRMRKQQKENLEEILELYDTLKKYNINYDFLAVEEKHKNSILSKKRSIDKLTKFVSDDSEGMNNLNYLKTKFIRSNKKTAKIITKVQEQTKIYLDDFEKGRSLDFIDKLSDFFTTNITQMRDVNTQDITTLWENYKKLKTTIDEINGLFIMMMLTEKGGDFIKYINETIEYDKETLIKKLDLEKKYFLLFMSETFPDGFEKVNVTNDKKSLLKFYMEAPTNIYKEDKTKKRQKT